MLLWVIITYVSFVQVTKEREMNHGMEDMAFERVKDLQREMENSRLMARSASHFLAWLARPLVWAWEVAVLTFRPLPPPGRPDSA
jgi:hypothetical protein